MPLDDIQFGKISFIIILDVVGFVKMTHDKCLKISKYVPKKWPIITTSPLDKAYLRQRRVFFSFISGILAVTYIT